MLERHHRGTDRNPARLLDGEPVRARAPVLAARTNIAGRLDGATEQQQPFGQRGLAGVRMRDDCEGPPPGTERQVRAGDLQGGGGVFKHPCVPGKNRQIVPAPANAMALDLSRVPYGANPPPWLSIRAQIDRAGAELLSV